MKDFKELGIIMANKEHFSKSDQKEKSDDQQKHIGK